MAAATLANPAVGGVHRPTCRPGDGPRRRSTAVTGYTIQVHREAPPAAARQRHRPPPRRRRPPRLVASLASKSATAYLVQGAATSIRRRRPPWPTPSATSTAQLTVNPAQGDRRTASSPVTGRGHVHWGHRAARRRSRRPVAGGVGLCWSQQARQAAARTWRPATPPPSTSPTPRRRWRCRSSSPGCRALLDYLDQPVTAAKNASGHRRRRRPPPDRGARQDGRAHLHQPRGGRWSPSTVSDTATGYTIQHIEKPASGEPGLEQRHRQTRRGVGDLQGWWRRWSPVLPPGGLVQGADQHTAPATTVATAQTTVNPAQGDRRDGRRRRSPGAGFTSTGPRRRPRSRRRRRMWSQHPSPPGGSPAGGQRRHQRRRRRRRGAVGRMSSPGSPTWIV